MIYTEIIKKYGHRLDRELQQINYFDMGNSEMTSEMEVSGHLSNIGTKWEARRSVAINAW